MSRQNRSSIPDPLVLLTSLDFQMHLPCTDYDKSAIFGLLTTLIQIESQQILAGHSQACPLCFLAKPDCCLPATESIHIKSDIVSVCGYNELSFLCRNYRYVKQLTRLLSKRHTAFCLLLLQQTVNLCLFRSCSDFEHQAVQTDCGSRQQGVQLRNLHAYCHC